MDPHHGETIKSKLLLSGGIKVKWVHGIIKQFGLEGN